MQDLSLEIRASLLRQHGNFSQAYSATYQAGLQHFGDDAGFLAYKMVGRTAMVLSDPVAPEQVRADLIGRFLAKQRDVCFCQVSRPVAEILAPLGFLVNELGYETRLDLATYNFNGQKKRNLRKATSQMARLGYVSRECALSEIDLKAVEALSSAWRRTRTVRRREVSFLVRPLVIADEPDVRRFFTFDPQGTIAALGFLDPIYDGGKVVGYSMSTRQRPGVDFMIGHALKRHAIETFQKEGRRWVYLGLSPVEGIEDKDFEKNWLVRRVLRFAYTNWIFNRFFYPFQGHAAHKRQFGGEVTQTYFAFNTLPALPRLLKMLRACEII